jgi:release factor glutamine methyltransferase
MATLQTLLQQAKAVFPNEAITEFFVQGLVNKTRLEMYTDKSSISQEVLNEAQKLLSAYKPNMPVQYLLHKAYFLSYELYVDERAMIPRFETEDLIMKTADKIKAPKSILDIGAGSGAIAIALADIFPKAKIIATDISSSALEVAKINVNKYNFLDRIKLYPADLFSGLEHTWFDLIISNPPYIPNNEIESLIPTVKDFEPRLALNGGKQGLEIIDRIIKEAKGWLSPDGLLAMEIDPRQAEIIKTKVSLVELEKDNQGLIRYAFIKGG